MIDKDMSGKLSLRVFVALLDFKAQINLNTFKVQDYKIICTGIVL